MKARRARGTAVALAVHVALTAASSRSAAGENAENAASATGATGAAQAAPDDGASPAERPVVVWPTLTPAGDDASAVAVHKPSGGEGTVYARAQELDATLRDAVQDLGYALDIGDQGPVMGHARDLDMIERAGRARAREGAEGEPHGTWVVSARLEPAGSDAFLLRIVVVPPRSKQLRVRVERVTGADVAVRGLVVLRELLASPGSAASTEASARPLASATTGIMNELRSPGRAVLAANAALFGAFAAFSIQRASGSDDPRLLYPLLTVGTGVGLGAALLVAAEWDVSTGDAWTLAGAAWWGAGAGILLANGQKVQPLDDRYAWGIGGGLAGLGLATFALTRSRADEGDAVLVHSGAGLGLGLGALADLFARGELEKTPHTGAGLGSAIGLATAGAVATFVQVSPSRVMLVDLGAGLGAVAGAAAGSALVFEDVTPAKTRGFVASAFGGALVGGSIAWWLTRATPAAGPSAPASPAAALRMAPFGGVVGGSATPTGQVPAYGAGVRGVF
jgi:hypothetical protein